MQMKKYKKKKLTKEEEKKLAQQVKPLEIEDILKNTEILTPKQLEEKNKEKEKEIRFLQGGKSISVKEAKDYVTDNKNKYFPYFRYERHFFKYIYKLKGWPEEEHNKFVKRAEVAVIIIRLVYGRFPNGVIQFLRKHNPVLFTFVRRFKYFEFLNDEGQQFLDTVIGEMVTMMTGYNDWDKFEEDYCKKHKISNQSKTKN